MARVPGRKQPASLLEAGFLFLVALLPLLHGCGADDEVPVDPEVAAAQALGLRRGARVHRVVLGGHGADEHLLPERTVARPGDAVEFVTVDRRIHRVVFPPDSLTSEALEFLSQAGMDASAPLVERGSRFLVRLEDAPPGRYPFLSHGHGGTAYGVILLTTDDSASSR